MSSAQGAHHRSLNLFKTLVVILLLVVLGAGQIFAATIDLPQTGQTTSYATGDDGDIQAGVPWPEPRFIDNGDGTVTDLLTGLMWLKSAFCLGGNWADALLQVADLNAIDSTYTCGGYTARKYNDWRLPNINELESLANVGVGDPSTWLNSQGFIDVDEGGDYWSSSTYAPDYTNAWYGDTIGPVSRDGKSAWVRNVWPVRSVSTQPAQVWRTGQTTSYATGDDGDLKTGAAWPSPRFTDNSDGTVTDNLTGLMWTKDANLYGTRTWANAISDANACTEGGYSDWRLPNRKELFSLVDRSRYEPAAPAGNPFSNVNWNKYWSSSTNAYASLTGNAWYVSMDVGSVFQHDKTNLNYVWPVRSGQVGSFGHLIISIEPQGARDAGAQWRILGGSGLWYNSGQSIPAIAGQHTVEFKPIDGWTTPDNQVVDVQAVQTTQEELIYDGCPADPNKIEPGICGCGVADTDTDSDGIPDCKDNCPADPNKTNPGTCGCGVADMDSDGDGTLDCNEDCAPGPDNDDFNNDGRSDILWRNTSTGKTDYWFVDGVVRTAYASLGVVSTAWEIEGTGDFDGDEQPDILWRNNSTREVLMTLMDGTAIASSSVVFTNISSDWQIVSVGDFDGDEKADILWRCMNFSDPANAGKPYISLMDGFSVKGSGYPGGKVPSDWEIQTVGDFDGDGKADIFWRNMNFSDLTNGGKGYVWLMNGTAIKSSAFPGGKVASAWEIQGAGDFDGDGKADILLRYTDGGVPSEAGKMIIWFMNGLTIKKSSYFKDSKNAVIQAGLVWEVATLGDYNNDGMSDMVWRNTSTGGVLDCLMNANILTSSGGLGTRAGSQYIIVRNL